MIDKRMVWVFIEQDEGRICDVSLELLGKGRELADRLGGELHALLLGKAVMALGGDLLAHGADHAILAEHEELEFFRTLPYARVIGRLVEERKPYIFLFGATATGRDLAPRLASSLRTGLTADCTDLQIADYESKKEKTVFKDLLMQIRPAFGGNLIATIVNPHGRPQMATVREGVMRKADSDPERKGTIETIVPVFEPSDLVLRVLSREKRVSNVRLKDASVIVAGGAGVAGPAEFDLLRELAGALAGELGASRAAVDAGLIHHDHQVGQTGVTV
ncbi:MAG: electron transfer flavoprotein subunit alpha/FixB family protein, partial [Spirochaetota bacterium]